MVLFVPVLPVLLWWSAGLPGGLDDVHLFGQLASQRLHRILIQIGGAPRYMLRCVAYPS